MRIGRRQFFDLGVAKADAGHPRRHLRVRVGGAFKLSMRSDASTCEIAGEYVAVDPPRRLVFTWRGAPTQDADTLVTVELAPSGAGTELTLTHERLPTPELRAAHATGWANMFDHLVALAEK